MPPERDLYELLGVPKTASDAEIKTAYRRLARKHHPDVNPGNKAAEEKFKEVSAAFEVLGNPEKRKLYDEFGADAAKLNFDPEKARAYQQWQSTRSQTRGGEGFETGEVPFDISDLFGDLFGGGAGGRTRGGRVWTQGPRRGEDIHAALEIDLKEAVVGGERSFKLDTGAGTKNLTVKIPPGSAEGTLVRLAGQGAAGDQNGPSGDLFLEIHVRPHPLVRLEGRDLSFDLPITVSEAMLGAEVTIPTFEGDLKLKIPKGSQSGRRLRLRGKGLPDRQGGRGDLHAILQVTLPEAHGKHEAEAHRLATELEGLYTHPVREKLRL